MTMQAVDPVVQVPAPDTPDGGLSALVLRHPAWVIAPR